MGPLDRLVDGRLKSCCELFMNDVCLFITKPLLLVQCDITYYCMAYLQIISALVRI